MPKTDVKNTIDYIIPMHINRLNGRTLLAPSTSGKNKEILIIYDQHSSLERWENLATEFRRYGKVSMPDLPGFGGMNSFYKINQQPTIDNLAGYLAAFIKLRYKRKTLTLVGIGFGFVVITRMLQNYPDLSKKVNLLIAFDGYAHKDDFKIKNIPSRLNTLSLRFKKQKIPSIFYRNINLYPSKIKIASRSNLKIGMHKYPIGGLISDIKRSSVDSNIRLWRKNDTRTFMHSSYEISGLDNCQNTVKLPVIHVISKDNYRFDRFRTEQHLGVVFSKVTTIESQYPNYSMSGIIQTDKPNQLLPRKLQGMLLKNL